MDEAQLPPVSRLGRYLLIDELGRGGMGRVYRARDETLGREVAIKVLPPERRAPKRMAALRREARAMARLQHPNVVEIFTVGAEEGLVYIAMELVRGGDLRQWCTAAQRPAPEILARFIQAGRGLEAAHEAGIIHRDFKPSNVLVTRHGSVKVTDFGLARVWQGGPSDAVSQLTGDPHTADPEVTFTGSAIGTPTYMPPEQHRGDAADEQSDQYAFCVALWYALAGTSPFEGASSPEMLLLRKEQGPPPLPRRVAVPVTVADAIERGMMPRSHDRWPSMRELLAALERPSTPRRWGALALGGAVLAAAMALTLDSPAQDPSACSLEDLEARWKGQRAEVEDAFSAANIETATGERTMKALDEYAQTWMALRDDACESAVARGCLQERGAAFSALVHTFADGDELQGDLLLASVSKLPSPQTCASAEVPSQTKHPQVLLVEAMLAAGRYDGALSEAEALLADPNLGDTPRADAQYLRGELLAKMERTDDALEVLDVAYFAASNAGRNETAFHAAVRLAFLHQEMRHDFERARTWLDQARAAAKRLGSPPRLLALLDNAEGTFAESQGRYDDAEQAFARSLEWHREAGSPQTALAPAYNNRASARAGQGDLAGAIEDTQRAVALFEEGLGFDHPNVLIALSNLTGYLHHANEYERELAACDRLDTLVLARFGKVHPEYAASLNQRGLALKRMGRLDEAERAIVQSIEIREQLGDDGPRAAIAWVNLGTMYLEQGRLEEAETWFVKGRETMESQLGATHPATAQVLGNVAQLRHAQGRLDEAEALLDRTVNDLGEALGPEHPGVAPFRAFRGRVRAEAGKTEAARADLEASLVALERAGGPEQDLALTKLALARLLRESSPERAQTLAKSAAEDFDRLEEEDEATAARALLDPS